MQRKEQIKQYELKLQKLKNMDDSDDLYETEMNKNAQNKKKVAFIPNKNISFTSDANKSNEEQETD